MQGSNIPDPLPDGSQDIGGAFRTEFSGLVSATAPSEQGVFAPCGFVLTSYK